MSQHAPADPALLRELYTEHLAMLQDAFAAALEHAGFDAVVIHAGAAVRQSVFDDFYWPFRPTPAFAHWLPLRKPDAALLVQPGKRPTLFFASEESFWESEAEPESDHFWDAFDEVEVGDMREVGGALPRGRVAFIGSGERAAELAASWGLGGALNPGALTGRLDAVRTRKSEYERRCLAEANRRAAAGHRAVQDAFAAGERSELELHLVYLGATGQDAMDTPYQGIVALDEHAAVLHHVTYGRQRPAPRSHSLLVDAGATFLGYASDITRTAVKVVGEDRGARVFAELIRRMEALQAEIIRRIAPGLPYESLHDQAHELLAPILRDLGLTRASDDELLASGATRIFLPHGLGHSLGLQVHDVGCRLREPRPDNPFLRNTSDIAEGQVFTIEPGCYFIPSLLERLRGMAIGAHFDWDLIDIVSNFGGVRIEDDIAVVPGGTVNLTRDNWPVPP